MPEKVILMAVGDIMLSENRGTGEAIKKYGPNYPFEKTVGLFRQADILFGNLEGPLSARGTPFKGQDPHITFRGDPVSAQGLRFCNFDILSLANNHAYDYGGDALIDTLETLQEYGVRHVGVGRSIEEARESVILERNGLKIGFLGYSAFIMYSTKVASRRRSGIAHFKIKEAKKDVAKTRKRADIVVVSVHWGLDFTDYPVPFQMESARELIECGATVILGHHPHHVQGTEKCKNSVIFYSLGDFVFDEPGQDSCIVKCELSRRGVESFEIIPLRISEAFRPEVIHGQEGQEIIRRIESLSLAYQHYDEAIARRMVNDFIDRNLQILRQSRNMDVLRNLYSFFILKRAVAYIFRKMMRKSIRILK